jgi:N utilization substance protein B
MQSLFEWDFARLPVDLAQECLERNAEEFAPGMGDLPFMKALLTSVLAKQSDLDKIIEKAAPDWPIDKISTVDRNILRLGLYELLFASRAEVPAKVAINEAIELAKTYGGETSGRFVNGVLGAVYKEIGEPGKEEVSKKKKKDIPYEQMPIKRLGGAVVYAKDADGQVYLALVHDVFGHWTLTKGTIPEGTDLEEGTVQEIKDELGLSEVKIVEKLGENEYVATHPEDGKLRKHVNYFLAEASYEPLRLEEGKSGLDDVQWFKLADILDLNLYNDIVPIFTKAINILLKDK